MFLENVKKLYFKFMYFSLFPKSKEIFREMNYGKMFFTHPERIAKCYHELKPWFLKIQEKKPLLLYVCLLFTFYFLVHHRKWALLKRWIFCIPHHRKKALFEKCSFSMSHHQKSIILKGWSFSWFRISGLLWNYLQVACK